MNSIQQNIRHFDPDLGLNSQSITKQDQVSLRQPQVGESAPSGTFFDALQRSMEDVNADQVQADSAIKDLIAGKSKNIHETMLAIQKADLSLKTMMQVRNKILEAYKEVMRMQV
jgi:flagellar hook-basal body complex protein FliE